MPLITTRTITEANNVNGVIPFEIEQLNSMRFLILEGAIKETDYNDNSLVFLQGKIPSLDKLDQLLILDFNFNQLTGPIPDGVWNMTNLRQLDLNHNVSARIPAFDPSSLLPILYLSHNCSFHECQFLTGNITSEIGNLLNLRFLQINHNEFTGELPQDAFGSDYAKDLSTCILDY